MPGAPEGNPLRGPQDGPQDGPQVNSPGSGLAGAVVLTRWGPDLASVGMMLVAARHARRGLGQALMRHLLAEAGDATVTLFATDMGRPLYEKLGFKQLRRNVAVVGWFRSPAGALPPESTPGPAAPVIRPATAADLPAILAVDRAAFGADRSAILTRLPDFAERVVVLESPLTRESSVTQVSSVASQSDAAGRSGLTGLSGVAGESDTARESGAAHESGAAVATSAAGAATAVGVGPGVIGYAAAWRNGPNTVIGPVVAPDTDGAKLLITELAARARGPVRLDLDPDRPELPSWARAHGLRPISGNAVMARGDHTDHGTPSRLHTPISIALA